MHDFLDVLLPLFLIVLLGFAAARLGWFAASAVDGLSRFVFDFAIPCLLFRSMAGLELAERPPWALLAAYYGGAWAVFALGVGLARIAGVTRRGEAATVGFAAAFSNTVLLGIPLILGVYGQAGALPLFAILALHSLLLLTTAIVTLELTRRRTDRLVSDLLRSLRGLAANPILLSLAAGLAFRATSWQLGGAVDATLRLLGTTASPCALFALGGALSRHHVRGHVRPAMVSTGLKNFVHPLLVWWLATRVFSLDPTWMRVAVVVAAMPTGVNAYLFANRYEAGSAMASSAVLISTAVSLVTVPFLLGWLG